ncbi:zinc ribbon domain-containing protein [Clostridium felsineum]|uniref:zinc ribbon domain-containing protein n=1 Tax=Clostridium felsineum TaxID=36839 RepID=UPI00098C4170|nr:zinc ribbon domain-containing protein [Clostridium felsineum]URZ15189.1 hypothetical protein CLFE_012070 [Clostridium felsineum DSM 794]
MTILESLVVALIIFLWIGQSLWIYLDARERKNRFSVIWAIVALFSIPVPLIIYIIVSRSEGQNKKCSNCGKNVKEQWIYCPYCGQKFDRGWNENERI